MCVFSHFRDFFIFPILLCFFDAFSHFEKFFVIPIHWYVFLMSLQILKVFFAKILLMSSHRIKRFFIIPILFCFADVFSHIQNICIKLILFCLCCICSYFKNILVITILFCFFYEFWYFGNAFNMPILFFLFLVSSHNFKISFFLFCFPDIFLYLLSVFLISFHIFKTFLLNIYFVFGMLLKFS